MSPCSPSRAKCLPPLSSTWHRRRVCREGIGTGRILQPQSHISISPCTFLSGLRRHKDAVAHPMGSTWTIPWWRDGFIHWHLPWRLFCDLKDNVEVGIQKWIHFLFEERDGNRPLRFRQFSQNVFQLHITYLYPTQGCAAPAQGHNTHFHDTGQHGRDRTQVPLAHIVR